MPETSTLVHFAVLGACAVAVAAVIGFVLHNIRLTYFAGLLCGLTVGLSAIVGLFLEVGLTYPPERDWHHIMWAMLAAGFMSGFIQVGRWQAIVDAVILAFVTGIASQTLFPAAGSDELFDQYRVWWLVTVPIAAATNVIFLRFKTQDGGASWGLWVVVAQLAIVSVAMMLSYGTLAGVALGIMAMAVILAFAMSILYLQVPIQTIDTIASMSNQDLSREKDRSTQIAWLHVAVAPIMVAAILLTICVRTYSFGMIAGWLYIPMLFLPTIICAADSLVFRNLRLGKRALAAASLTTAVSATAVIYMIVTSGPDYQ